MKDNLNLPVTTLARSELSAVQEFALLCAEEPKLSYQPNPQEASKLLGRDFLNLGNSFLDFFCASRGDLRITFPIFNRAYALLPEDCEEKLQLLYQTAIAFSLIGESACAYENLNDALKLYLRHQDLFDSSPSKFTALFSALDAYWPDFSGGAYRITATALFEEYAKLIEQKEGPEAKEQFWVTILKQLPIAEKFCTLQANARVCYSEILLSKGQFGKAISLLNEALYCLEKVDPSNYQNYAVKIRSLLDKYSNNNQPLSDALVVMKHIESLSKAECSILVAELSSPSTVKQRKLYCALSLAYAADQCASKCIDVTELSFAVQLWWAAISEILDASPSRAIAYFYKIALASIETAQDNVAAQALLNALLLEKSLKLSKPESLIAAERSILKFHPFSKVQSDMANFYRSWRTQVLENLDGKAISDEEFDSIINDIRSKYKFENEAALVPESKAASLDI